MSTIKIRILEYLLIHPDGADDDELTSDLHLKNRAQANQRGRQLAEEGLIERRIVDGKYRNFIADAKRANAALNDLPSVPAIQPWFWEGNVQAAVVRFLHTQGYSIVREANTLTHETGKDIEAVRNGERLWVTVKGYPKGTPKTNPSTQAPHWLHHALYDIIVWRGEDSTAQLAITLPEFPRYRNLSHKLLWLQPVVGFSFYWVYEDGTVSGQ